MKILMQFCTGEYWNFVESKRPSLQTDSNGVCVFGIAFTDAITSPEPSLGIVKVLKSDLVIFCRTHSDCCWTQATHGAHLCESSLVLDVRPWRPRDLHLVVDGVRP